MTVTAARLKKNKKPAKQMVSRKFVVLLVVVLVLAGCFVAATHLVSRRHDRQAAQQQAIRHGLGCDDNTMVDLSTSTFCDEKFYRNPRVSTADVYAYENCVEVLSPDYNKNMEYDADTPQQAEAARLQDQADTKALRQTCTDKHQLEQARLKLVKQLNSMISGAPVR